MPPFLIFFGVKKMAKRSCKYVVKESSINTEAKSVTIRELTLELVNNEGKLMIAYLTSVKPLDSLEIRKIIKKELPEWTVLSFW